MDAAKHIMGAGLTAVVLLGPSAIFAQADKNLVVAVTDLTTHLDPMGFNANVNMRVSQNALETLIRYDFKTGKLGPGLATLWKMTSPTTLELTLRDGVTCHNGEPFTAEDVEVAFGPLRFKGDNAPGNKVARDLLGIISSVTAIDEHTVRVETSKPDPLIELRLASWMSEVPCADAYRAATSWEQWGLAVVGTGPYKVAEVKPGELQRFERFDGYWGGDKAPVASFELKVVPELGARVAGLLTGEYDIVTELTPDQFETISANPATEVVGGPIRNIRSISYDTRFPTLADSRIRRALSLAIDRKLIVDTLFHGKTDVSTAMQMPVFSDMYISEFAPESYNPERAKQLLAEAGYKGEEIPFWYLHDYYTGEVTTVQILQQMWKAVGLNVTLSLKENWDQILDAKFAGQRGIVNESNNAVYPDPLGQIMVSYGPGAYYQNEGYWTDADFNKNAELLWSTDLATRRAAFKKMLEDWDANPPGSELFVLPMFYGKQKSLDWGPIDVPFMDFRAGNLSVSSN